MLESDECVSMLLVSLNLALAPSGQWETRVQEGC